MTPRQCAAAFQRRLDQCDDMEPPRPYPAGVIVDRATYAKLSRWCYAERGGRVVFGDTPVYRETGPDEAERWNLEESDD